MTQAAYDNRWKALAVLGIAYLMVVLDVSIVNVALPSIETDLGFAREDLQWVVSGYALTFGGFLLLGGRMGDLLGRRMIFMIGLASFAAFSLLAGLSTSPEMLIVARLLQGAAGAVLSPSVFSIVSVLFKEGSERNKALGILGAIAGSGAAIGVLAGGVLTEYVGWEWIFFVNVPTQTTNNGWTSMQTIGALAGSAVLMAAFLWIENRSRSPLVPLGFFRRRTPTAANVIGLGLGTITFGTFFLLSLYMQQVLGFSAIKTGVAYLAVALTAVVASGVSQALVTRVGVKPILAIGMGLLGGGLAYFTQVSPNGSYVGDLLPGFLLIGIGLGFAFVPVSIAALAGVTGKDA